MKNMNNLKSGFTLVEMLVVAALMIVITSIGVVNFRETGVKSRNSKRQADIAQVRAALELYRSTNQAYPIYSGSSTVANFTSLIANTAFNVFLANTSVVDPVNVSPNQYTYRSSANGFTYTICYTPEPTGSSQVCLTNP